MLKLATALAILLLVGGGWPARAADCLQQIDGLVVEYDLPASEGMAGTQTSEYGALKPPPPLKEPAPGQFKATPPGRAGMAETRGTGGGITDFPKLPPRKHLTEDQRRRLLAKLHEARATEALGNEDQCLSLLHEAQTIVAERH